MLPLPHLPIPVEFDITMVCFVASLLMMAHTCIDAMALASALVCRSAVLKTDKGQDTGVR